MGKIFLTLYKFFFIFLPVSVGNHTNYDTGGGTGGGATQDYSTNDYSFNSYNSFSGVSQSKGTKATPESLRYVPFVLAFFLLLGIWALIPRKKYNRKYKRQMDAIDRRYNTYPDSEKIETFVERIREHDKNFSPEEFLAWSEKVFIQLEEAFCERDSSKLRPFESDSLFETHKAQIGYFIKDHTVNIKKDLHVEESSIYNYYSDAGKEYLAVCLKTRSRDYIISENTRKIVKGDKKATYLVKYKAKFKRTVGVQTGKFSNKSTTICPNCGSPTNVNFKGQCADCGKVITDANYDWVLCHLDEYSRIQI